LFRRFIEAQRKASAPDVLGILIRVTIGTSLVLIAAGAILHWAITAHVSGVNIQTVGTILMIVGILGLILSLLYTFVWADRRRHPADYDAPTTRYPPRDRY
jgi:peptidoglycan biosynthesis protein MviN/MurJ (putative lipid II flippase)